MNGDFDAAARPVRRSAFRQRDPGLVPSDVEDDRGFAGNPNPTEVLGLFWVWLALSRHFGNEERIGQWGLRLIVPPCCAQRDLTHRFRKNHRQPYRRRKKPVPRWLVSRILLIDLLLDSGVQRLTGEKVVGGFFDGFLAVRYHRRNTVVGGNDKAPDVPAMASWSGLRVRDPDQGQDSGRLGRIYRDLDQRSPSEDRGWPLIGNESEAPSGNAR